MMTARKWDGDRLVEQTVDNGDGTGTRTVYDADGNVTSVEELTGLPIPEPPEPDPVEALQAQVAELTAALEALRPPGQAATAPPASFW